MCCELSQNMNKQAVETICRDFLSFWDFLSFCSPLCLKTELSFGSEYVSTFALAECLFQIIFLTIICHENNIPGSHMEFSLEAHSVQHVCDNPEPTLNYPLWHLFTPRLRLLQQWSQILHLWAIWRKHTILWWRRYLPHSISSSSTNEFWAPSKRTFNSFLWLWHARLRSQ